MQTRSFTLGFVCQTPLILLNPKKFLLRSLLAKIYCAMEAWVSRMVCWGCREEILASPSNVARNPFGLTLDDPTDTQRLQPNILLSTATPICVHNNLSTTFSGSTDKLDINTSYHVTPHAQFRHKQRWINCFLCIFQSQIKYKSLKGSQY